MATLCEMGDSLLVGDHALQLLANALPRDGLKIIQEKTRESGVRKSVGILFLSFGHLLSILVLLTAVGYAFGLIVWMHAPVIGVAKPIYCRPRVRMADLTPFLDGPRFSTWATTPGLYCA
jgi:nitrate reductase NapE component